MSLKNYSLLVGKAKGFKLDDDNDPHIEILIEANKALYRIAVNVRSKTHPNDLLYRKVENLQNGLTVKLNDFDEGVIDIRNDKPALAIDYVTDNEFEAEDMHIAPYTAQGPNNDLKDFILPFINHAILNNEIKVYAFGEMWGPENKPDSYFGFTPGRGIHDIHMNQGSTGGFKKYNGPKQDGALLFRYPDGHYTAIYLAFQSQEWKGDTKKKIQTGSISIIAALIDAKNPEEGKESVTLFNRSDIDAPILNWKIKDKINREFVIKEAILKAGEALRIILPGKKADDVRLSNSGGIITLLDDNDSVVSSVSYKKIKDPEGWTTRF